MFNPRFIGNLKILVLLLGFLTTVPFAAVSIASNGHFAGAVYAASLMPVEGAFVTASGPGGYGSASTDSLGQYSITHGLDTGNYTVTASATGFVDAKIENVHVIAGADTPNINFILNASGGISGKVTDADSSLPLESVAISATNATGSGTGGGTALTDANGNYVIAANLPTGTYNVTAVYPEGHLKQTVSSVTVTAGIETPNIDLVLQKSATITGTVTDSMNETPLPDIIVTSSAGTTFGGYAITNSSGKYIMNTNLGTGTYNVTVIFPTGYLTKTVSDVAVTAGSTVTVNIALQRSGIISGLVTEAISGSPIANASVVAISGSYFGSAESNTTGHYRITSGLGNGTYVVYASALGGFGQALDVNVTAGLETANVNIQIAVIPPTPSGAIAGRVTNTTGSPIAYATVNSEGPTGSGEATTDSNGYYNITSGLETGAYTVNASKSGYVMQSKTPIAVIVNQTTTVDFELSAITSGSISGTVQSSETPIPEFPYQTPLLILVASTLAAVAFAKLRIHRTKNKTD